MMPILRAISFIAETVARTASPLSAASREALAAMPSVILAFSAFCAMEPVICSSEALVSSTPAACSLAAWLSDCAVEDSSSAALARVTALPLTSLTMLVSLSMVALT
ncbi:hypothetical protein NB689_003343 [Xanthomonas sacchari]|nr:hypothetical protein [Xanthomonas sacchari]